MSGLRTWFMARSLRERRLLLAMAALLVVTILWAGIILPVRDGLETSQARYDDAVVRLATTRGEVDSIKANGRRPALTASLADTVRAAADQAGLAIATLDEQGAGRVHLTIQSARPGALSGWLAGLEVRGILIDAATLRDNGDKSVGADLVLKARAT
ncbi:type II secretion system protein GspM [Sphingomonas oligophenolica]|uniref:Type II secretion system protein M n=1 Tax=Sphingomonas oligophenolica TaxID=301154 RepID=A0A502CGU6_9SPHN|nr:type II secretion system protein GspM [Sphingomonas oligophenolica]TPG12387.1 type II secretion system protein M [Sphingomonas oligophenolica]